MPAPPQQTEAWVVEELGGPFVLRSLVLDDPLDDEVLVQMTASGICHTDSTMAKGLLPGAVFPIILGHEGSGRVLSVGKGVTRVAPGDNVLLSFASCDSCSKCKAQTPYACETWGMLNFGKMRANGSSEVGTLDGGQRVHGSFFGQSSFSRHAVVKATSCVKVLENANLKLLAPLGCGMQTGSGAVTNVAKPSPSSTILISGMGAVGCRLFSAVTMGVKTIIAVDTVDSRLDLAKSTGATHTVNARAEDVLARVSEITRGKGVDYAIEATGVAPAAKAAFMSLGLGGLQVQVGDSGIGELSVPLSAFLQGLRTIAGCVEGNCSPAEMVPDLMHSHKNGSYPMEKICKLYSWKDLPAAMHDAHSGAVIKPIIVFDE